MITPIPCLPTTNRAAVWQRVPTHLPVAFIRIDDGYRPETGDPVAAAEFVESFTPRLPVTVFATFYAATSGQFPPLTVQQDIDHLAYLRRFIAPGYGVQCHDSHHYDLTGVESGGPPMTYDQQLNNEIKRGRDLLARSDVFGSPAPTLFGPPYGRWNDDTRSAAFTAGFKVILGWTHTYSQVVDGKPINPGDILLLHFNDDLLAQLTTAEFALRQAGLEPAYLADYVK